MILVLSKAKHEASTDEVIDWLAHFEQDFFRVNGEDFERELLDFEPIGKVYSEKSFILKKMNDAKIIWYRKWYDYDNLHYLKNIGVQAATRYYSFIQNEIKVLNRAIFQEFKAKKWLNYPLFSENKLQILRKAQEVGLNIPATVITNNKETVVTFLKEHEIIITKPLGEAVFIDYKNVHFLSYTIVLNNSNIREIPETFFPSLFQENIDKKYEIRAFVLGKKIFSMAIFSQNDPKTLQDFRRYNYQNPNRFVPFNLPSQIESKIFCLMDELDLQTGSIDLIKDTTGKYYFLEINPNGQYGMVSKPCNYFLEREIAEYLILNKD
jgi:ATP-GRASP peptide maturase of grasp-with-spasm system